MEVWVGQTHTGRGGGHPLYPVVWARVSGGAQIPTRADTRLG